MSETPPPSKKSSSLSLSEMMRIMDVATEMRNRRETVEKEFAVDETKRLLREKLLQTTSITGERVTEAEVDAAIEAYFSTLYTYREPTGSLSLMLAHLYVRRGHLAIVGILGVTLLITGWWTMHIATTRFSKSARSNRKAGRIESSISSDLMRARAISKDPAVIDELDRWQDQTKLAREQLDTETLDKINSQLTERLSQLNEAYEVRILADPNEQSGFTRYFEDENGRRPAYYLIVYAKNEKGQLVRRTIENAETRQSVTVDRWAEQVPRDVYNRIAEDKKSDGILNETLFAVKERGKPGEEIRLEGSNGKPISRMAQLAAW
jgi:Family of unknown function (DUF6384)